MSLAVPRPPLRLFFDLAQEETWHRRELETRLASAATGNEAILAASPETADCILTTVSHYNFGPGGRIFRVDPLQPPHGHPPTFVWYASDHPTGRLPGFYCSLPLPLFDPRLHRTFCYPFRYNECVQPFDQSDARYLYAFIGGLTSGLRHRLLTSLAASDHPDERLIQVQSGPWDRMFDRSGIAPKAAYAEALRRTRFFLCPRGNGVSSIRLFETMQAARVPVIISDAFVPPADIDWGTCSVSIRERDIDSLPTILRERAADWPVLARAARRVWESHFSDEAILHQLGRHTRALLASRPTNGRLTDLAYYRRVMPHALRVFALRVFRRLQKR